MEENKEVWKNTDIFQNTSKIMHTDHKNENTNNLTKHAGNTENTDAEYPKAQEGHRMKLLFGTFFGAKLLMNAYVALMAPFFPQLAASRGVSQTMIGLVFSCFELATLITSPFIGWMMPRIGPNFMYVAGLFVVGSCSILFGFVDRCPPGPSYIALCIAIRCVEGVAAACVGPVGQAVLTAMYPDKIASITAYGAMCTALGIITGPLIGGTFYQVGGFELPFLSVGILVYIFGILAFFTFPSTQDLPDPQRTGTKSEVTYLTLMRSPYIIIMIAFGFFESLMFSFVNATLGVYLANQFNVGPGTTSLVFLGMALCYALLCPLMGRLIEKKIAVTPVLLVVGASVIAMAHLFVGPAPFILIPKTLWLTILSAVVCGAGMALSILIFPAVIDTIHKEGFKTTASVHGLVLGIRFTVAKAGSLTGPLLGGALVEKLGFPAASTAVGFLMLTTPVCMMLYQICMYSKKQKIEKLTKSVTLMDENAPLLNNIR